MRPTVVLAAFVLALVPPSRARAATVDPDSMEGIWTGEVGLPQDRVPITLRIARDSSGRLEASLYQFAYVGLPIPGPFVREGEAWVLKEWAISLARHGDALEGTYFRRLPITLRRGGVLPVDTPPPPLPTGPGPAWRTKLGAAITAPAALADRVAFVGTTGGMFYAIGLDSGQFVWSFAAGRPIFGGALVVGDAVYFPCDDGRLYRLDRERGTVAWRYELGDGRVPRVLQHQVVPRSGDFDWDQGAPTPVLADGVLYVGSGDGSMHAIDARSGARRWRAAGRARVRGTVALDSARVYFGDWDGVVHALSRRTGRELWRRDMFAAITTAVVLVGDRLVVGNRGGILAALDPATGAVAWRQQLWGSSVESEAAPAGGTRFYIGSSDLRRIAYMDARDGTVLWRRDVFGWAWPRPALDVRVVYAGAVGSDPYQIRHLGSLTALDRETGAIVWRWPMPTTEGTLTWGFAAPPVVGERVVVVGGLDGTLYAFPRAVSGDR